MTNAQNDVIVLDLTTAFRMLMTLHAHGFVEQNPADGKYRLGISCLELGSCYINGNDIRPDNAGSKEVV